MDKNESKQSNSYIKAKSGPQLGYRTNDFFRGQTFGPNKGASQKFNAAQFKTQHKGGS